MVFPWPYNERSLWSSFGSLQEAAGLLKRHGFHDFRRAFATQNADRMSAEALQHLMRHKSYTTTQLYINYAKQVKTAVADLYVPDVLLHKSTG